MNRIVGCNLLKTVCVLCIGTIVLTGCGSPGASKSSEVDISASELPKETGDYRVHAVAFSVSAGVAGDYRLGVKAAGTPPTAEEIRNSKATMLRTLDSEAIKMFIGFPMDTDFFDTATDWESTTYKATDYVLKFAEVEKVLLKPGTDYTLYAVAENGDDTVYSLFNFTTDNHPSDVLNEQIGWYGYFPGGHVFTVRSGDPFLLPITFRGGYSSAVKFSANGVLLFTAGTTMDDFIPPSPTHSGLFYSSSGALTARTFALLDKSWSYTPDAGSDVAILLEHVPDSHTVNIKLQQ